MAGIYERYQKLVKDKDRSVQHFISNNLIRTLNMFSYSNLPEGIRGVDIERVIQTNGHGYFTEVDGQLYCLQGDYAGVADAYGDFTEYRILNSALKLNKTYKLDGDEGVIIKSDPESMGMLPILGKHAVLLTDSEISLNTAGVLSRITLMMSAGDDKTRESAEKFIADILEGEFSVIAENSFYNGVKAHTAGSTALNLLPQLIELNNYYKSSLNHSIGLNANANFKRERLITNELNVNEDNVIPFVESMLTERKEAIQEVNDLYGLNVTVDFGSVWKAKRDERVKIETDKKDITDDEQ